MYLKLYTKTNCPQCFPVDRFISHHRLKVIRINIDKQPEAANELIARGMRSMPGLFLMDKHEHIVSHSNGRKAALDIYQWSKRYDLAHN